MVIENHAIMAAVRVQSVYSVPFTISTVPSGMTTCASPSMVREAIREVPVTFHTASPVSVTFMVFAPLSFTRFATWPMDQYSLIVKLVFWYCSAKAAAVSSSSKA